MNIVFLTIGYPIDINSSGIYTDLMSSFVKLGHQVSVFMQDEVGDKKVSQSDLGVSVYPVFTGKVTKTSFITKGINLLLLQQRYYNAVLNQCKDKIDLLLYSTPPITFCGLISKIKQHYHCITYLLLKDIFPQNAVDLKIFSKKSPFYLYFRQQEKKLYRNSDFIGCMSPANVEYVKQHNSFIDPKKIHISPNCIIPNNKKYTNLPHQDLRLIYGGNLGKPQGIDFIIECCKVIEKTENVVFTIVGSGTEYEKLNQAIKELDLKKTQLYSFMPKEEYLKLISDYDMGMIFLDSSFTIPNFPSRVLDYLNNGLPIFACTDRNSDVKQEICDAGAGVWCESKSVDEFKVILQKLVVDKDCLLPMRSKSKDLLKNKYNALIEAGKICDRVYGIKY